MPGPGRRMGSVRRSFGSGFGPWRSIARALTSLVCGVMLVGALLPLTTFAQAIPQREPSIVGSWFVYLDGLEPSPANPAHLVTIHADDTLRDEGPLGAGIGAWREDPEGRYELTLWYPRVEGDAVGALVLRAVIVAPVGPRAFEGDYTLEFPFMTQSASGVPVPAHVELDPGRLVGYRVFVSPRDEAAGPWPPSPTSSP